MDKILDKEKYDEIAKIAVRQLEESVKFKEPIIARKKPQIDLYNGKFPRKLRSLFSVPLPVMSGMVDTLCAAFDEPIQFNFEEKHPADYFAAQKVQAFWNDEKLSSAVTSKWDLKARWDRKNAIFWGRGIQKYYAESDPKYKSVFEIVSFEDFYFQPKGGGHLETHLFAGQGNIIRTQEQIENNESYDEEQVKKLIEASTSREYLTMLESARTAHLESFAALNLDPESHNYVGQVVFTLCEWVLTYKGERWYLVFDPITKIWLRCCPLKEVYPSGKMPWTSWATHEDQKNFASKSFSDDIYPIADSIITLFNQELTNREKANYHTRAYDEVMFPDVVKLDSANYRPDALIPFDSQNGTRKISDGLYEFQTGQLSGTIDLIGWMEQDAGKSIGVTDLTQGGSQKAAKKASVVFAEQQNINKRFSYQSQSYTECYEEIGTRFIEGLKEHMPEKLAIRVLGEKGYEWDYLRRKDLNTEREFNIKVISSTAHQQESKIKQDKKLAVINAIEAAGPSPEINQKTKIESLLRMGEFEEDEIRDLMDTQNSGNKAENAKAEQAIIDILEGKEPKKYYGATTYFMQKLVNFATDHREELKDKYSKMIKFATEHASIASENMMRKARRKVGGIGEEDMAPKMAPNAPQAPTANATGPVGASNPVIQ